MSNVNRIEDDQGKFHNWESIRKIDNVVSVVKDLDNPARGECALKRKYCTSKFVCWNKFMGIYNYYLFQIRLWP